jgi:hypothetical protein
MLDFFSSSDDRKKVYKKLKKGFHSFEEFSLVQFALLKCHRDGRADGELQVEGRSSLCSRLLKHLCHNPTAAAFFPPCHEPERRALIDFPMTVARLFTLNA